MATEKGKILKQLDTSKYRVSFNDDKARYFAVFALKDQKGWIAINSKEEQLFTVYNTSIGEPSPDELVENKIRIVDSKDRIGFANEKGIIVIKPRFEMATTFYKGKAIIAEKCKMIPWDEHQEEKGECQHFSFSCKRHGYINSEGKIIELGNFSFEQMEKKTNWKRYSLF